MFDNNEGSERRAVDEKLRRNLQKFNRDSLRILHPVFVDALRLLARRDHPDRKDTLLLPLAWPTPAAPCDAEVETADHFPPASQGAYPMVGLHDKM